MESANKEIILGSSNANNGIENKLSRGRLIDPNMDPKKLKRVMASRQYSQKYRMKQLHYILHLETEVKALQAEIAITNPRIKHVNRQNSLQRVENGSMKQELYSCSSDLMFKQAQYEELKKERDILKQLYAESGLQFGNININNGFSTFIPSWNFNHFDH